MQGVTTYLLFIIIIIFLIPLVVKIPRVIIIIIIKTVHRIQHTEVAIKAHKNRTKDYCCYDYINVTACTGASQCH